MHVQQIVVHCTRRRRFPPGSWALNRTLLRPRVHPISGPDHVLGRCWRMEIPYTAVDTPEYWTRMPCLTLAYIVNIYVTSVLSYRNPKNDANEEFSSRSATWRMSLTHFPTLHLLDAPLRVNALRYQCT